MFLKLQMQDHDDFSIYLNFDEVKRFYRCGSGKNSWTDVFTKDGDVYNVTDSCESIHARLVEAGGRG